MEAITKENEAMCAWREEQRHIAITEMATHIYEQAMARSIALDFCADNATLIGDAAMEAAELWYARSRGD